MHRDNALPTWFKQDLISRRQSLQKEDESEPEEEENENQN
jgi:hypothetical protein